MGILKSMPAGVAAGVQKKGKVHEKKQNLVYDQTDPVLLYDRGSDRDKSLYERRREHLFVVAGYKKPFHGKCVSPADFSESLHMGTGIVGGSVGAYTSHG